MQVMVSVLATALVSLAFVGTAAADAKCEDVHITITNRFVHAGDNKDIKVVGLDFWDDEDQTWRSEDIDSKRIGHGDQHTYVRNLQKVGGEHGVLLRVSFRYNRGGTAWSEPFVALSEPEQCIDGMQFPVHIE